MRRLLLVIALAACTPNGHYECRGGHYEQEAYTYFISEPVGKSIILIPATGYREECIGGSEVFIADPKR